MLNLRTARVTKVRRLKTVTDQTFNLNVNKNHNFFASNLLVHNCIDDPHNVKQAESPKQREKTLRTWDETLPTRLNDPEYGVFMVIMQRVHQLDLTGHILAKELGWTHICLPAEYESHHPTPMQTTVRISSGPKKGHLWYDPRKEGEPLWADRFKPHILEEWKKRLGSYACTPAESPILMADLTEKPIGEVKAGDQIVGFEKRVRSDGVAGRMRLTRAMVTEVHKYTAPVVDLGLDSGRVVRCTTDHKWFTQWRGPDREMYLPARVGESSLARVYLPDLPKLSPEDERLAGWLSGFFDGEGSVSNCEKRRQDGDFRPSASISFYQGSGRNKPLCDKLEHALAHFGFEYTVSEDERKPNKDAPCYGYRCYRIKSDGVPTLQKFLHIVQPTKWKDRVIDGAYGAKFIQGRELVVSSTPSGTEDVYALTTTTGNYVVWGMLSSNSAGQLQQRPSPREGGLFKRHWFNMVPAAPSVVAARVRAWDLAGTKISATSSNPDWTVGLRMSLGLDGIFYIEDVVRFRDTPLGVDSAIMAIAQHDRKSTRIRLPLDPGQAGKAQQNYQSKLLAGYTFSHKSARGGDKEEWARPVAAQAEAGNIVIVEGDWDYHAFLDEICNFPNADHDDQVDAMSHAFDEIINRDKKHNQKRTAQTFTSAW
jgi:predicted phage terminase large subunit-like protein